ncbi:MAG: gamma-glutamylcyclotransferase, partial [Pseudomonadota bacterium]
MKTLFFYGTLRDRETLAAVLGPHLAEVKAEAAVLADHAVMAVAGEDFPTIVAEPGGRAEGLVVSGLSDAAIARLVFFEDEFDYELRAVEVETTDGLRPAEVFFSHGAKIEPAGPWDFAAWAEAHRGAFVESARELMAFYGTLPDEEVDRIWPGIRIRAYARARAGAGARPARFAGGLGPGDVEVAEVTRPYVDHFAVEHRRLRHRRFGGGMSSEMGRAVFATGDAVTVLPWDPGRDRVLLIEQFRAGPHARGDTQPWMIEPVAGRIDRAAGAEEVLRAEALEEAGLTLGRLARVGAYYPSPAILTEEITSYVGEAKLDGAGGLYGLPTEHEDIRAFTLPFS